jgi:hypothetical protein
MKNIAITAIILLGIQQLNAQSSWNIGISSGCVTNVSKYDNGEETANALFTNNPSKSANLAVNLRKKISEKFSLQTGLNVTQIGFSYALAKDYSLLKPWDRNDDISASTGMLSLPVMAVLNTPKNCSNVRFVFGAGVAIRGINNNWNQNSIEKITPDEGGNTLPTEMTSVTKTTSSISPAITWQIGMERMLKKGNSIGVMLYGNQGLTTIAESTVRYTASNKNYEHTFINRGSFVNIALAYNFAIFGTKKLLKNK